MTPKSPETKSRGLENMTGRPRVVMDVGTERMDASERTKLQKTEGTLTTSKNMMNVTKEAIFINLPKFFLIFTALGRCKRNNWCLPEMEIYVSSGQCQAPRGTSGMHLVQVKRGVF